MQYNAGLYNAHQYNVDFYSLALSDSLTPTDATISKYVFLVKLDSSALSDTKVFDDTMHALLETITSTDVRKMLPYLTEVETITMSEALTSTFFKILVDSMTLSDAKTLTAMQVLLDFIFFSELIRVEVVNKALNDEIRLNDWMSIKTLFVEKWHD